jgi:uncharacterized small protein (DUF1192 family)
MFSCVDFHSEFHALEITRYEPLTNKFCMHFFELPKIPKFVTKDDGLKLWLALFSAKTEEELKQIEALEVPVMTQAIGAYRSVTATDEFKELERLRSRARHNEASALGNARREERDKWQGVVAEKDATLVEKDMALAESEAIIADQTAEIARLCAQLGKKNN